MPRRDKGATWRSTSVLGWSKARVLQEGRAKRPYRTSPRGIEIDWDDPWIEHGLDVWTSEVKVVRGQRRAKPPILVRDLQVIGIEFLADEAPPQPAAAPNEPMAAPEPPRRDAAASGGYQTDRVRRALDDLEEEGVKLSDHTRAELKRLVLERIPHRPGFNPPSRQVLDREIKSRLTK